MTGNNDVQEAIEALFTGAGRTVLAVGAPRCGKTQFAMRMLLRGLHTFGQDAAVMAVSGRLAADTLGNQVIRTIGATTQMRPVTTLPAVAFRLLTAQRAQAGQVLPRLLNGAEQDALIRRVLAVHMQHAAVGDDCATCALLRSYFAQDGWVHAVTATLAGDGPAVPGTGHGETEGASSEAVFARGISDAFIAQARDMLARMDELGVTPAREADVIDALPLDTMMGGRLRTQWRLAFALRREYEQMIRSTYPGEYRLDSSRLFLAGATAVRQGDMPVPQLLVLDDCQDTTLAGLRFLEALAAAGSRLLLVGNPDEAVQTFRGSYPEYVAHQVESGALHARVVTLPQQSANHTGRDEASQGCSYLETVTARVSLSIPSPEQESLPLPSRPGKTPRVPGSFPIAPLAADSPVLSDGSVHTALYRSPREELDDVVWRIKRAHLDAGAEWNSMAVIAHDNATVRTFGERLRRDGVPVRYSSVTRPLKDEPWVQGLFALIELARLRRQGLTKRSLSLTEIADCVRAHVAAVLSSPLVTTGARPGEGRAARMEPSEAAMRALASLMSVLTEGQEPADTGEEQRLPQLVAAWERLRAAAREQQPDASPAGAVATVTVDDSLVDARKAQGDDLPFSVDALYVMLALDDACAPAGEVEACVEAVMGNDPQARAFARVWQLVARIARDMATLPNEEAQYVLALAWDATGVARPWQRAALAHTPEGRAANDRLDAAMRLFQCAENTTGSRDIVTFMHHVRSMHIEADSLAHVGPIEQAVTLTTPAGAAGRHWARVWIPALQQDVWPNLAERNTLFGGEDLADIVLHGQVDVGTAGEHDARLAAVLASEKKSLLVALTRADVCVSVSAVWNDDCSPSDFLYGYLPERFPRGVLREQVAYTPVGGGESATNEVNPAAEPGWSAGLDADPRGLVAAARATLIRHGASTPEGQDAAATLALLADHGIADADPQSWNFTAASAGADMSAAADASTVAAASAAPAAVREAASGHAQSNQPVQMQQSARPKRPTAPTVTLSPSSADGLWGCPVCWLLSHRLAGPVMGTVSTSFGSVMHAVAQRGSEEGLDLPAFMAGATHEERMAAVTGRLTAIYRDLREDPSLITDTRSRYQAMTKDDGVDVALNNLASYFVTGNEPTYGSKAELAAMIGTLTRVDTETAFLARFTADNILAAYRATPGMPDLTRSEFIALLGTLAGGWPDGMDEHLVVRLSGRIDRKETRQLDDGSVIVRLIDYKTGTTRRGLHGINDLQLICYQLGLAFPEETQRQGTAPDPSLTISQSMLFHMECDSAPAMYFKKAESAAQPALFAGGGLNTGPLMPRNGLAHPMDALAIPVLPLQPPDGIPDATWQKIRHQLGGTQALWALTMIARVFYAAAASRSRELVAHPTAEHLNSCKGVLNTVCPACAGQIDTVYETRKP